MHGVGGQTVYSIGYVFIDANVRTKSSPVYQGIMQGAATLGPALGYLIGGMMLDIYTDFHSVDTKDLSVDQEDPRWVGAWWLGFLSGGCLALLIVFFISPYPRMLPSSLECERYSECHQDGSHIIASKENFGKSIRDFPKAVMLLLRNSVFMFVSLAGCTESMLVAGFATFFPKFIQNQFSKTASQSALITGALAVPGAVGGSLFGGLLCRYFNLCVKGQLKLCIIFVILAGLSSLAFLIQCDTPVFAGVTVPYFFNGKTNPFILHVDLIDTCNKNCGCSRNSYTPVCGADNIQYFSACHAGCAIIDTGSQRNNAFYNCSCVVRKSKPDVPDATEGVCGIRCSRANIMYPLVFLLVFFALAPSVPSLNTILRIVADQQRALALGIKWTFVRFLGAVPGPILFGWVFDKVCTIWQKKCDDEGSCWVYDTEKMAHRLMTLALVIKAISAILFSLALFFYKPPLKEENTKPDTHLPGGEVNQAASLDTLHESKLTVGGSEISTISSVVYETNI